MSGEPLYNDPEWLRARYIDDHMSMAAIAKLSGCYPTQIFRRLHKFQIPVRGGASRASARRACERCGKVMKVKLSLVEKGQGRFCSRACHYAHAKRLTDAEEAAHAHARSILNVAVRTGRIERPAKCSDCGANGYVQGHHPDHSKPLEVEWLCLKCHGMRHRKRQPV